MLFFVLGVAVAASVFTITAMAVGRYLAITRPISTPSQPKWKWALLVLLLLWIIAFSIFSPLLWVMIVEQVPLDFTFDGDNANVSELKYDTNADVTYPIHQFKFIR